MEEEPKEEVTKGIPFSQSKKAVTNDVKEKGNDDGHESENDFNDEISSNLRGGWMSRTVAKGEQLGKDPKQWVKTFH